MVTAASLLSRTLADDRDRFAADAAYAAELMNSIAQRPEASHVGDDLARLSQRVTDLIRRAATIKASAEAVELMKAQQ